MLFYQIFGSDNQPIIKSWDTINTFSFTVQKEGLHQFCFQDVVTSKNLKAVSNRIVKLDYSIEHPHAHATIEEESIDDLGLSLKTIETQLTVIIEEVVNRRGHNFYFNKDLGMNSFISY